MRSVEALDENAVAESRKADPEFHQADALARYLLEGAEHPAGARGRLQLLIGHLAFADLLAGVSKLECASQ